MGIARVEETGDLARLVFLAQPYGSTPACADGKVLCRLALFTCPLLETLLPTFGRWVKPALALSLQSAKTVPTKNTKDENPGAPAQGAGIPGFSFRRFR